jgi:hypothetical protein
MWAGLATAALLPPLLLLHTLSHRLLPSHQTGRLDRLDRVCRGHRHLTNSRVDFARFLYEPHSNVLWCMVPKAGSTTMVMTTYSELARRAGHAVRAQVRGDNITQDWRPSVLYPFRVRDEEEMEEALANRPFLFAVVWHPYERLVSSYLDFNQMTGGHNRGVAEGTFSDFLMETVLKEARGCREDNACPTMNHHWRPLDSLCSFCALNYTALGAMETFGADHAWLSVRLGIVGQERAASLHAHAGPAIQALTARYFAEVSNKLKKQLKSVYKYDFLMFGYNPFI